jgi:hypothetical protein
LADVARSAGSVPETLAGRVGRDGDCFASERLKRKRCQPVLRETPFGSSALPGIIAGLSTMRAAAADRRAAAIRSQDQAVTTQDDRLWTI